MVIAVRVERVTLDTTSNRFVVILRDDSKNRWLPIVVGPAEAQAIALQLEKIAPPETHDSRSHTLVGRCHGLYGGPHPHPQPHSPAW